jgi:4-amino-4-deoxy-L-arabinose transferase-like glycosyltransferase
VPALAVPAIALALMTFVGEWRNRDFRRGILISLGLMLPLMMVLPILLILHGNINARFWTDAVLGAPFLSNDTRASIQPFYFLQILPWFALPALPFALWLWVRNRKKLRERIELALPLVAFITLLVTLSLTREAGEARALAMLIPLSLAAAMALDRLPGEVARIMDWFGLIFFGVVAAALWFYWLVALTQFPERAANSFARQVPDFTLSFNVFTFVLAVALTLVWLYAVIRAHRNNRRAVVNWAAGITLVWVLANLLGQPVVNHVLSHRKVVTTIASIIPTNATCVASFGLGDSERASFDTFANLRFVPQFAAKFANKSEPCNWLLTQGSRDHAPVVDAAWQLAWEGARPRDKDERFRLYHR